MFPQIPSSLYLCMVHLALGKNPFFATKVKVLLEPICLCSFWLNPSHNFIILIIVIIHLDIFLSPPCAKLYCSHNPFPFLFLLSKLSVKIEGLHSRTLKEFGPDLGVTVHINVFHRIIWMQGFTNDLLEKVVFEQVPLMRVKDETWWQPHDLLLLHGHG